MSTTQTANLENHAGLYERDFISTSLAEGALVPVNLFGAQSLPPEDLEPVAVALMGAVGKELFDVLYRAFSRMATMFIRKYNRTRSAVVVECFLRFYFLDMMTTVQGMTPIFEYACGVYPNYATALNALRLEEIASVVMAAFMRTISERATTLDLPTRLRSKCFGDPILTSTALETAHTSNGSTAKAMDVDVPAKTAPPNSEVSNPLKKRPRPDSNALNPHTPTKKAKTASDDAPASDAIPSIAVMDVDVAPDTPQPVVAVPTTPTKPANGAATKTAPGAPKKSAKAAAAAKAKATATAPKTAADESTSDAVAVSAGTDKLADPIIVKKSAATLVQDKAPTEPIVVPSDKTLASAAKVATPAKKTLAAETAAATPSSDKAVTPAPKAATSAKKSSTATPTSTLPGATKSPASASKPAAKLQIAPIVTPTMEQEVQVESVLAEPVAPVAKTAIQLFAPTVVAQARAELIAKYKHQNKAMPNNDQLGIQLRQRVKAKYEELSQADRDAFAVQAQRANDENRAQYDVLMAKYKAQQDALAQKAAIQREKDAEHKETQLARSIEFERRVRMATDEAPSDDVSDSSSDDA